MFYKKVILTDCFDILLQKMEDLMIIDLDKIESESAPVLATRTAPEN